MTALVPEMSGWINSLIEEGEAAARILAASRALPIELAHVENGLVEVLGLSEPPDLLDFRLSRHEIVSVLAPFDFRAYFPALLAEITFRNSIIPATVPTRLREQTVRRHGQVWRVHWTETDSFPSNPHAHNLDSGLKLHLGTGQLFRKKLLVGKIRPKDLLAIRSELTRFDLPPLAS